MINRITITAFAAVATSLLGTGVYGQFLPFDELSGDATASGVPEIRISSDDPCKNIIHDNQILKTYQKTLDSSSEDVKRMKLKQKQYTTRLEALTAKLNHYQKAAVSELKPTEMPDHNSISLSTTALNKLKSEENSIPISKNKTVSRMLRLAIDKAEQIEQLIVEQRQILRIGFEKSERLIARCNSKSNEQSQEQSGTIPSSSFSDTLSLSHALFLEVLDLSLAQSRQRSYEIKNDAQNTYMLDSEKPAISKSIVDSSDTAPESDREIKWEAFLIAETTGSLQRKYMDWKRMVLKSGVIVARLDMYLKKASVDVLRDKFDNAVSRIVVTGKDITKARRNARKEEKRIDAQIIRTEKERVKSLIASSAGPFVEPGGFSMTYKEQVTRVALREMISLLVLNKEHLRLLVNAYEALYLLQKKQLPPSNLFEKHQSSMDNSQLNERLKSVAQGREAWRRQRIELSDKPVDSAQSQVKQQVLDQLDQVINLFSKQEEVLESNGRVAYIVHSYLARHDSLSHGFWWQLRCGILSLLFLVAAVLISGLLNRGILKLSNKTIDVIDLRFKRIASAKSKTISQNLHSSVRYTYFIFYIVSVIALWVGTIMLCLQIVWDKEWKIAQLPTMIDNTLFLIGEAPVTTADILKLIAILMITIVSIRLIDRFLRHQVFHFFEWDSGVKHAVVVVIRYVILLIGFSLGLEYLEVGLEVFAVFLGIIGIGIGFGLQKLAANYVSGFVILFSRPVKNGDFITAADDLEGEIVQVGMRTTTVRTRDNISVILPNTDIVSEKVINWSYGDSLIRLRIPIGVAYGTDIEKLERVLLQVCHAHQEVLYSPAPGVWFTAFGESALKFELLVWISNITERFAIISDLNKAIDRGFRENRITVPFPQRDVHIKGSTDKLKVEI